VPGVGGQRDLHRGRAGQLDGDRVGLEGAPGVDHLVTVGDRRLQQVVEQRDRPGPDREIAHRYAEAVRQRLEQVDGAHVRVPVHLRRGLGRGGEHAGERRVRVLVTGQLVRRPAVGARGRTTGLVSRHIVQAGAEANLMVRGHARRLILTSPQNHPRRSDLRHIV
jgi:hypothetical protein